MKYGRTVCKTSTGAPGVAGSTERIFWNKAMNPIGGDDAEKLVMHVGFNGWLRGVEDKREMTRATSRTRPGDENNDGWVADVPIRPSASVLDFAVDSDADEMSWDNNDREDYRLAMEVDADDATWAVLRELTHEEKRADALRALKAEQDRIERREREDAAAKAKAIEVGLKQQSFIIRTEPEVSKSVNRSKYFTTRTTPI